MPKRSKYEHMTDLERATMALTPDLRRGLLAEIGELLDEIAEDGAARCDGCKRFESMQRLQVGKYGDLFCQRCLDNR